MSDSPRGRLSEWRFTLPLAAALALGLALVGVLRMIARPLALLIIAMTFAEAVVPLVAWLQRYLRRRTFAIAGVYLALAVILVAAGALILPTLLSQAKLLLTALPDILARIQARIDSSKLGSLPIADIFDSAPAQLGNVALHLPAQLLRLVIDLLVIVFLSVYWLLGRQSLAKFILSLVPERLRERAGGILREAVQAMGGYVRGVAINAAVMGVLAWLGLTLIRMPFPVVLGVLTMFGETVPVIGPIAVGAIVTLLALQQSVTKALIAVGLFTALIQLEGHILTPNIMKRQTHVPQTLVLLAIVIGGALGGVLGVLVAIPVAAGLRVLVLRVLAPMERHLVRVATRTAR